MKFAIEVGHIEPGDVIEQSECEAIIGFARSADTYKYQFALMQLQDHVVKELWKVDKRLTVTVNDGALRILTHEEASKYNAAAFAAGLRKSRRSFKRLSAVDPSKLTAEALDQHKDHLIKQSRVLQAIGRRTVGLEPAPTQRPTPKVLRAS
jgi:hypothetical protein